VCSEVPWSGPVAAQQMVEAALLGLDTVHNEHCNVRTTSQRYSSDSSNTHTLKIFHATQAVSFGVFFCDGCASR
jgi:hypothetical protein